MTPTRANLRRARDIVEAQKSGLRPYLIDEYIALALDAAERRACRGLARLYRQAAAELRDDAARRRRKIGVTSRMRLRGHAEGLDDAAREARRRGKG